MNSRGKNNLFIKSHNLNTFLFLAGGSQSPDLRYVAVPLVDNTKCIKPHTVYDSSIVTSNMVCAGNQG